MGTKNQSMAAKRQKRKSAKRKSVPAERQHQRFAEMMQPTKAPTDAALQQELATKGIMAVADKYRGLLTDPDRGEKGPTNLEVTQGILKIIEMLAPIHSAVEIAVQLKEEGTILLSEDNMKAIDIFDEFLVKIAEDITAIRVLMEENQTFEDFAEIYVHCFDNVSEVMQFHARAVFDDLLKPNQEAIEVYAKEHIEPGETDMNYAFRMHDQRMEKVQPLYRTMEIPVMADTSADGIPQEFIPADELSDDELENDEPKDIN